MQFCLKKDLSFGSLIIVGMWSLNILNVFYKKGQSTYKIEPAVVLQIGEGVDQVMQVKGASTYRAGQERGEKGKKGKTTLVIGH